MNFSWERSFCEESEVDLFFSEMWVGWLVGWVVGVVVCVGRLWLIEGRE